jgi:hypothetical protein
MKKTEQELISEIQHLVVLTKAVEQDVNNFVLDLPDDDAGFMEYSAITKKTWQSSVFSVAGLKELVEILKKCKNVKETKTE